MRVFKNGSNLGLFFACATLLAACGGGGGGGASSSILPAGPEQVHTPATAPPTSQPGTPQNGATSSPSPAPASSPTSNSSGPTAILSAGYADLMDSYTGKMPWVTSQSPSLVPSLRSKSYVDFYVSSVREQQNYTGMQPNWNTVNLKEDAFTHTADPAMLTAQPLDSSLAISWQPDARGSLGVNVGGYVIYAGTAANALSPVATVPAATTSYALAGLSNGNTEYFAVHSLLNGNDSAYSWTEAASVGVPSSLTLDSPSYSLSTAPAPGRSVTLNVQVHVSGSSSPSLQLQTLVNPRPSSQPSTTPMVASNSGQYTASVAITMPAGFYGGIAFRITSSDSSVSLPASGQSYYVTSPNQRLHFGNFANTFLMNAASPAWQGVLASFITAQAAAGGYNGILLDDTDGFMAQARPEAFPAGYSDGAYIAGVVSEYSYLRSNVPSNYGLCPNGFSNSAVVSAVAPYAQRAEIEEIAYDSNSWGYAPESYWKTSLNNALVVTTQKNLPARMVVDAHESDTAARLYIVGTYLLAQNSKFYYDLETSAGMGSYYPEYGISLGAPLQNVTDISQQYVLADQAYERTFANGRVIVNPSASVTTPVISLGATYKQIVLSGGSAEHGGTMSTVPVTSVQLGPHQAAVLMR